MHNAFGPYTRKKSLWAGVAITSLLFGFAEPAAAATVWIPGSSTEQANGHMHTNLRMVVHANATPALVFNPHTAAGLPPYSGYYYETPASLACVHKLVTVTTGCNPNSVTAVPSGGSKMIAIVDAYHDANAAIDLANFSKQFNLAAPTFSVVYASGKQPAIDSSGGWELEESLDIEWAHAMAPKAKIILVEAASNSLADLFKAVDVASAQVAAAGGGEVSMSWGAGEFSGETSYDSHFTTKGVVYVVSSGDSPGTEYPSVSPNVVSAGGTSTGRNPVNGNFLREVAWEVTGGGISAYEKIPTYQSAVAAVKTVAGTARAVPDVSFNADPTTGVWVLYANSWYIVGGTSLSAPAVAGIINLAGKFNASSAAELSGIYGGIGATAKFNDVTMGGCGPWAGYVSGTGYDLCSGVGSPASVTGL